MPALIGGSAERTTQAIMLQHGSRSTCKRSLLRSCVPSKTGRRRDSDPHPGTVRLFGPQRKVWVNSGCTSRWKPSRKKRDEQQDGGCDTKYHWIPGGESPRAYSPAVQEGARVQLAGLNAHLPRMASFAEARIAMQMENP